MKIYCPYQMNVKDVVGQLISAGIPNFSVVIDWVRGGWLVELPKGSVEVHGLKWLQTMVWTYVDCQIVEG